MLLYELIVLQIKPDGMKVLYKLTARLPFAVFFRFVKDVGPLHLVIDTCLDVSYLYSYDGIFVRKNAVVFNCPLLLEAFSMKPFPRIESKMGLAHI